MIEYGLEVDEDLAILTRLFSVTSSEFCSVSVDVAVYQWDYMQFVTLEKYVNFCEDRRKWSDKGEAQDRKKQEMQDKMNNRR